MIAKPTTDHPSHTRHSIQRHTAITMTSTYNTQTRFSTDSRSSSAYYVAEDEQDELLGHRSEHRQVAHLEPRVTGRVTGRKAARAFAHVTRWILPLLLVAGLAGLVGLALFCRPHSEASAQVAGEFNGLVPDCELNVPPPPEAPTNVSVAGWLPLAPARGLTSRDVMSPPPPLL